MPKWPNSIPDRRRAPGRTRRVDECRRRRRIRGPTRPADPPRRGACGVSWPGSSRQYPYRGAARQQCPARGIGDERGRMSARTALFITCVNDVMYPGTGRAAVALLRRLGVEVDFPMAQSCCGQMHANTGYRADTAKMARHFVSVFGDYDRIVVPSASCGAAPGEFYRVVAEQVGDAALARDAEALLPRIRQLTEFLTDDLGAVDVGAYFPHRVTYHPTCH